MNLTAHSPLLRRRIGALVFAGLFPLALASCSDDEGDVTEAVAEDSTTSTASSETSDQEDAEASETTESTKESSKSKKRKPNPTLGSSAPASDDGEPSIPFKKPKKQAKGECIWRHPDELTMDDIGTETAKYCDGTWAIVGTYGTGGLGLFTFKEHGWELVPQDSEYANGFGPCYTERYLRELGVPNVVLTEGPNCSG